MITIEDFLNKKGRTATRTAYKSALKDFFNFLDKTPEEYIISKEKLLDVKTSEKITYLENYASDINRYRNKLTENKTVGHGTIRLRIAAIKGFLEANYINLEEIKPGTWKEIKQSLSKGAIDKDVIPTHEQVKQILLNADVKMKAYALTLLSSGMRPNEACSIELTDYIPSKDPTEIHLSGEFTKNKESRIVYISDEATDAINIWLKIRKKYLQRYSGVTNMLTTKEGKKVKIEKSENDNRLFPFNTTSARIGWNELLELAGFADKHKEMYVFHLYILRKFFATEISKIVGDDFTRALLGHSEYLSKVYIKKDLKAKYLEGMRAVTIFERVVPNGRVTVLQKENEAIKQQLQQLIAFITPFAKENLSKEAYEAIKKMVDEEDK